MTSQKSQDIVEHARGNPSVFSNIYPKLIENTCIGLDSVGKSVTKENTKIPRDGFAVSIILEYLHDHNLETETDTFLTNSLVNDVSSIIWETWLKQIIKAIEKVKQGNNVIPLHAVN